MLRFIASAATEPTKLKSADVPAGFQLWSLGFETSGRKVNQEQEEDKTLVLMTFIEGFLTKT